ncbi:MAG: CehA/McbA family metallohydrolase [Bacteroidota bacterium]
MRTKFTIIIILFFQIYFCNAQQGNWYMGDLHAHTTHSDGKSSVTQVLKDAEQKGFQFFVLTDHDNIYTSQQGTIDTWTDTAYHSSSMILLYAVEWTTDNGHANLWNSSPFPYDSIYQANLANDPVKTLNLCKKYNTLMSINHPLNDYLTWKYGFDFGFKSMEILNGPYGYFLSKNNEVVQLWDSLLIAGRRINGVGGSDMHELSSYFPMLYPSLGSPSTHVYSSSATSEGILDGLKKGHVVVSNSTTEPFLEFAADTNNDNNIDIMMGDNMVSTSNNVNFQLKFIGAGTNYSVDIIKNGELFKQLSISESNIENEFSDEVLSQTYYRAVLKNSTGNPVAWTNPIYFGYQEQNSVAVSANQFLTENTFKIYPNPAKDLLNIQVSENSTIQMFDINGRQVIAESTVIANQKHIIALSDISNGVYFVKIYNNKTVKIQKVVIAK